MNYSRTVAQSEKSDPASSDGFSPSLPRLVRDVAQAVDLKRDRLIAIGEALRLVGVGKSTWYNLMAAGRAPKSVLVTPRCVRWSEAEVLAFVQERIAEARGNTARRCGQMFSTAADGNQP